MTRPGDSDDEEVDEQEDTISEFRRVQIVQETRGQGAAEPRPLPELKPLNDKLPADRGSHWALVLGDAERPSPIAAYMLGPPAPLQLPLPPPSIAFPIAIPNSQPQAGPVRFHSVPADVTGS